MPSEKLSLSSLWPCRKVSNTPVIGARWPILTLIIEMYTTYLYKPQSPVLYLLYTAGEARWSSRPASHCHYKYHAGSKQRVWGAWGNSCLHTEKGINKTLVYIYNTEQTHSSPASPCVVLALCIYMNHVNLNMQVFTCCCTSYSLYNVLKVSNRQTGPFHCTQWTCNCDFVLTGAILVHHSSQDYNIIPSPNLIMNR